MFFTQERVEIPYCQSLVRLLRAAEDGTPVVSGDEIGVLSCCLPPRPHYNLPFLRGGRFWRDWICRELKHRLDERSPHFFGWHNRDVLVWRVRSIQISITTYLSGGVSLSRVGYCRFRRVWCSRTRLSGLCSPADCRENCGRKRLPII